MAFHLFSINEVYSNADGTVQYVELLGLSNGQNFLLLMGTSLSVF